MGGNSGARAWAWAVGRERGSEGDNWPGGGFPAIPGMRDPEAPRPPLWISPGPRTRDRLLEAFDHSPLHQLSRFENGGDGPLLVLPDPWFG